MKSRHAMLVMLAATTQLTIKLEDELTSEEREALLVDCRPPPLPDPREYIRPYADKRGRNHPILKAGKHSKNRRYK